MGVVPIVLVILAMKIPILGLIWLVWWAGRSPQAEGPGETVREDPAPRRPDPWRSLRGPRRRGPHGGAASTPVRSRGPARKPHPAPAGRSLPAARTSPAPRER